MPGSEVGFVVDAACGETAGYPLFSLAEHPAIKISKQNTEINRLIVDMNRFNIPINHKLFHRSVRQRT